MDNIYEGWDIMVKYDSNAKIEDFYIIIKDAKGNVVFPKNSFSLKQINDILKHRESDEDTFFDSELKQWFDFNEKDIYENGERLTLVSISNVTKYKNNIKSLSLDVITNIPNRQTTRALINDYLKHAIENDETFAIVMADLDNFKTINDTYGHYIGDLLLKSTADVFRNYTRHNNEGKDSRPSDIIGRIGGDEFVILLKNITKEKALEKTEIIKKATADIKIDINGTPITSSTASFGMTFIGKENIEKFKKQGIEIDAYRGELLRRADLALYESKNHGRNLVTEFNNSNESDTQKSL